MNTLALQTLLPRMNARERDAFVEFGQMIAAPVRNWLTEWNVPETELDDETVRCVLAFTLLAVSRQHEFTAATFPSWLRLQARNVMVKHFRAEQTQQTAGVHCTGNATSHTAHPGTCKSAPPPPLLAAEAHQAAWAMDGTLEGYRRAGAVFHFPGWWVGAYHRDLQDILPGTVQAHLDRS